MAFWGSGVRFPSAPPLRQEGPISTLVGPSSFFGDLDQSFPGRPAMGWSAVGIRWGMK